MIFAKCPRLYGEANLLPGTPSIETHTDVVLDQWTLYDRSRRMIPASSFHQGIPTYAARGGPPITEFAPSRVRHRLPDGDYLWLGPFHPHFGHFLLSMLARAWAVRGHLGPAARIVYVGGPDPEGLFKIEFVRECLTALGIAQEQVLQVNGPAWFPRITVPAMSFVENHSIFSTHMDTLRQIAGPADRHGTNLIDAPVYISKEKVASGVRSIINEPELTSALLKRGVEVACPETLPFQQQLEFWRNRQTVIGFASSALHMSALFQHKRLCTISHDGFAYSNQVLLDLASGNQNIHVCAIGSLVSRGASAAFSDTIEIQDVERFADGVAELAQRCRVQRAVSPQRLAAEPRTLSQTAFVDEPFGTNLARTGTATQSSTYQIDEGHNRTAEGALSGRLTGSYQCATRCESEPWWQVELPGPCSLYEVRVFNRCDNPVAQARLTNLSVLLSQDGLDWTLAATRTGTDLVGGYHGQPYRWLAPPGTTARFVRLKVPGMTYFHVDQVEVFGEHVEQ